MCHNMTVTSSDDAGGGLRGTRATLTRDLIRTLHNAYGIEPCSTCVDLGGSSSLNLLVPSNHARYVVRVYRPYVSCARLEAIHRVRRILTAQGIPCAIPITTLDGQTWTTLRDRVVEVEPYIEHDGYLNTLERMAIGLPLLGQIHSILQTIEVNSAGRRPLFANFLSPDETWHMTLKGCSRIRSWEAPGNLSRIADCAEELAGLVTELDRERLDALPTQLVHGDYWDNNVLFDNHVIALVTDFDYMGERMRIDDLALTLYFANDCCDTDDDSDARIKQMVWMTQKYEQGLDVPLSEAERRAVPLALARQPLWSIGGWVALLDDEQSARRHASDMLWSLQGSIEILSNLEQWQDAILDAPRS